MGEKSDAAFVHITKIGKGCLPCGDHNKENTKVKMEDQKQDEKHSTNIRTWTSFHSPNKVILILAWPAILEQLLQTLSAM